MDGIRCAQCGGETKVVRSRSEAGQIRRVRKCRVEGCPGRQTSIERPAMLPDDKYAKVTAIFVERLENLLESLRREVGR